VFFVCYVVSEKRNDSIFRVSLAANWIEFSDLEGSGSKFETPCTALCEPFEQERAWRRKNLLAKRESDWQLNIGFVGNRTQCWESVAKNYVELRVNKRDRQGGSLSTQLLCSRNLSN
jgi:hypothetical protein